MSISEKFDNIYKNFGFGYYDETRSGHGSLLSSTEKIRDNIVRLVLEKKITSITDFPCGDFNWMKEIVGIFKNYTGCDISQTCIEDNKKKYPDYKFECLNLVEDKIPQSDLLFIRDVLGHLPLCDCKKIIENILSSDCKYLLTTTFAKIKENKWSSVKEDELPRMNENLSDYGLFYPVNLMEEPYNFPLAERFIEEDVEVINYNNGVRKALGFWKLDDLRKLFNKNNNPINELDKILSLLKNSNSNIIIQNLTINL